MHSDGTLALRERKLFTYQETGIEKTLALEVLMNIMLKQSEQVGG